MKILLTIVFIILAYINYQHLNIGFLSLYHSVDEWAFHLSLQTMYDGFMNMDLKKYFSHGFLSYGHIFWAINFFATLPFFLTDNIEITIYIPRMISAIFAVSSIYLIYKISRQYVDKWHTYLIVFLALSMLGFWKNAMWIHPDWMMTFFIILSIYFYSKDNFNYKKYFLYGTIAFGLALASKIQAITFYPFIFIYIFYGNILNKTFYNIANQGAILLKSIFINIGIFIVLNPYLLHPKGFNAWVSSFLVNMESNATNHGSGIILSWQDKLFNAIDENYLFIVNFIILLILSLYHIYKFLVKKNQSILGILAIYFIMHLGYLLLMVNKDWQHYYLTIMVVSTLLFIIKIKHVKWLLSVVVLLNIFYMSPKIYNKVTTNPITTTHIEKNNELLNIFEGIVSSETNILISSNTPFEFNKLNLTSNNIHYIWGDIGKDMFVLEDFLINNPNKDSSYFTKKDFIVIDKSDSYFSNKKINKINKDSFLNSLKVIEGLNNNVLGYVKFKNTKYFYIWRKIK